MTFHLNEPTVRQLQSVRHLAGPLNALGLLSDEHLEQVSGLLQVADTAVAGSEHYESARREQLKAAGRTMAQDGALTGEAIAAAVKDLAPADDIDVVTEAAYNRAVSLARGLAFARVSEAAAVLDARIQDIVIEVNELSPKLDNVETAQNAMNAKVVKEWQRVAELQDRYDALNSIVTELRSFDLIPKARKAGDFGEHWNYRRPAKNYTWRQTIERGNSVGDGGRAAFLFRIRQEPWVPTTADEAAEVKRAWDRGEIEPVG